MASYKLVCSFSDAIVLSNPNVEDFAHDATSYRASLASKYAEIKGLANRKFFPTALSRASAAALFVPQADLNADKKYSLDHLPPGYLLCVRKRKNDARKEGDVYLYGHPSGTYYDSCVKFLPHFVWLMDQADPQLKGSLCECQLCLGVVVHLPQASRRLINYYGNNPERTPGADGEAVVAMDGGKTKRGAGPQVVKEPQGPILRQLYEGWAKWWYYGDIVTLGSANLLRDLPRLVPSIIARDVKGLPACPRGGEVVLFHRPLTHRIDREEHWMAGVVVRVSDSEHRSEELASSSTSPFAVEGYYQIQELADLTNQDRATKSNALRQHQVGLPEIRPFCHLGELLSTADHQSWDSSIKIAMMMMASFAFVPSLTPPFKYIRPSLLEWDGVWLGAELLHVGDAIRILPEKGGQVTDVMVIEAIPLVYDLIYPGEALTAPKKGSKEVPVSPTSASITLSFSGRIYTTDAEKADTNKAGKHVKIDVCAAKLPKGMWGYEWYSYKKGAQITVEADRVIGRCHDALATKAWFGFPTISAGSEIMNPLRKFAITHDHRIAQGDTWHWSSSRTSQLDIAIVAGTDEVWLTEPVPDSLHRLQILSNNMGTWRVAADRPKEIKSFRASVFDDLPALSDPNLFSDSWASHQKPHGNAADRYRKKEARKLEIQKIAFDCPTDLRPLKDTALLAVATAKRVDTWPVMVSYAPRSGPPVTLHAMPSLADIMLECKARARAPPDEYSNLKFGKKDAKKDAKKPEESKETTAPAGTTVSVEIVVAQGADGAERVEENGESTIEAASHGDEDEESASPRDSEMEMDAVCRGDEDEDAEDDEEEITPTKQKTNKAAASQTAQSTSKKHMNGSPQDSSKPHTTTKKAKTTKESNSAQEDSSKDKTGSDLASSDDDASPSLAETDIDGDLAMANVDFGEFADPLPPSLSTSPSEDTEMDTDDASSVD
ncbi:MAG: hypothetical protein M1829_002738 [Trizodia sp. TS-e1964]|nr:MAG: hypothetical protein M1829_002738 [Trizodia sp. TS-e1964]